MNLGFHYHVPAMEKNNQIYMPGYLGRFVDTLATHCNHLICFMHTPMPEEEQRMEYTLTSQNVNLVSLGPHSSLPNRVLHAHQVMGTIRSWRDQIDVLLIRGPTPLLPWVARGNRPLPTVLLLVGDQLAGIDDLPQPRWRKELIRAFWKWNENQQMAVAKSSLTFVNSHLLYKQIEKKVPNLVETHTTTLKESDFYIRENTCLNLPVRLLYTGRIDRAKGLLDIVDALALLVAQGEDVVLDLVGWPTKGSTIFEEINQLKLNKNISDRIFYQGYKPVGEELFAFYKQADIYLIASQSSEGFPRTIWEAMAHSLPVVATRVGSIPAFISGVAELVDPKNSRKLAEGISRVINNSPLRQEYISKGCLLARENTLETQVVKMVDLISSWVKRKDEYII